MSRSTESFNCRSPALLKCQITLDAVTHTRSLCACYTSLLQHCRALEPATVSVHLRFNFHPPPPPFHPMRIRPLPLSLPTLRSRGRYPWCSCRSNAQCAASCTPWGSRSPAPADLISRKMSPRRLYAHRINNPQFCDKANPNGTHALEGIHVTIRGQDLDSNIASCADRPKRR